MVVPPAVSGDEPCARAAGAMIAAASPLLSLAGRVKQPEEFVAEPDDASEAILRSVSR